MKKIIILLLLLNVHYIFAQTYKVNVSVTKTNDYCGGMQPDEEILQELNTPSPITNTNFYIIKGLINKKGIKIYRTVKTDEQGLLKLKLPKGNYSILSEWQIKEFEATQNDKWHVWNNDCLKKAWTKPLLLLKVKKTFQTKFNIHTKCFYNLDCVRYNGPFPS